MNDHSDEFLSDDELAKAFDIDAVEPTDEHVEHLRGRILLHTSRSLQSRKPTTGATIARNERRRLRIPLSLVSISAVVLLVLLVARPFVKDATAGLQNSLKATREALWIHGSTRIEHGDKAVIAESWCNPSERIVAFRSPHLLHFVDYEEGLQSSYMEDHGKIFRWSTDPNTEGLGRQFVHALLNDQDLESSFPLHDVSKVAKTEVVVGGSSTTQYSFQVQLKADPTVHWQTSIRTDSISNRIVSWEDLHTNGMRVKIRFDYPDAGPHNIFEMGAPSTADVINIATPESNLFGS